MRRSTFEEKDPFAPIHHRYKNIKQLYSVTSAHQTIQVLYHEYFGRMLVLDDVLQITERDEFFYHELLVQVPLAVHPNPQRVLILGGGDGGSLTQVLLHDTVTSVDLVELDLQVIDTSKKFFPHLSESFYDPRVRVTIQDGGAFLKKSRGKFDVIIVDAPDPVGPGQELFTLNLFHNAYASLTANGVFVSQTESLHFHRDFVRNIQRDLASIFPVVDLYTQALATYAGNWWTFSIATKGIDPRRPYKKKRFHARYYSGEVHRQVFLPRRISRQLLSGKLNW